MPETPGLSIVIVNSDGLDDTINCLTSIEDHPPSCEYEILLVDNCSSEDPAGKVGAFDRVRLIRAPEPQNFAKNYNLGLRAARGAVAMILNNDTLAGPQAFDPLLEKLADPKFAFVGPLILSSQGTIQTNCARDFITPVKWILIQAVLHPEMPLGWLLERYRAWRIGRMSTRAVAAISGACMAARMETLEEIGLLDEAYPLYFEEDEWCHRAQTRGYRVGFVKESVIRHLGDRSIQRVREWSRQSEYLSALRYFRDYFRLSTVGARVIWAATLIGYLQRWAGFRLIRRRSEDAAVYFRLIGWLWRREPGPDLRQV